jgi:SNF2 family DNA or RNA helicase
MQLPRSSLLFDQMGLGKTIQALALLLANPGRKGNIARLPA